uniref:C-type lectin domain-containing protein n=1 Tax=Panagrellus redivivus TaxID=6233 RepID=A0A7E4W6Y0_PANRE
MLLVSSAVLGSLVRRETKSILLDQSVCPYGWQPAGDICVRLFFHPTSTEDAKTECAIQGAELVNIIRNQQENKALINDLTDIINIPLEAGVAELTWLVGGIDVVVGDPQLSYNLWMSARADDEREKSLALQRKNDKHFELVTVSISSSYPFICALLPLTRRALLYEQALLPKNVPEIIEGPKQAYHYANRPEGFFVTIDVESSNSSYIISGGSLLIPISRKYQESATYHCTGSNPLGTVRSTSTIVRSAFIESFRRNRLDVYPINPKGAGTRIECQSPQHYPTRSSPVSRFNLTTHWYGAAFIRCILEVFFVVFAMSASFTRLVVALFFIGGGIVGYRTIHMS